MVNLSLLLAILAYLLFPHGVFFDILCAAQVVRLQGIRLDAVINGLNLITHQDLLRQSKSNCLKAKGSLLPVK